MKRSFLFRIAGVEVMAMNGPGLRRLNAISLRAGALLSQGISTVARVAATGGSGLGEVTRGPFEIRVSYPVHSRRSMLGLRERPLEV